MKELKPGTILVGRFATIACEIAYEENSTHEICMRYLLLYAPNDTQHDETIVMVIRVLEGSRSKKCVGLTRGQRVMIFDSDLVWLRMI